MTGKDAWYVAYGKGAIEHQQQWKRRQHHTKYRHNKKARWMWSVVSVAGSSAGHET